MSRCDERLRKGQWSVEEDECLKASVALLGESRWDAIAKATGLKRSGKSCRLRWLNYLRPHLKQGPIAAEEEQIILRLHQRWGNKWARIARRLPGRTDNEIKNYWRGCLRKKTCNLLDQTVQDCTSKVNNMPMQETSLSPWNSDDDESDYNDVIKEMSKLQGDKSEEASPINEFGDLQDVLMATPHSPYESHFSNWVSMFPGEDYYELMGGSQRDVTGCCNWDKLWDMDLFTSHKYF